MTHATSDTLRLLADLYSAERSVRDLHKRIAALRPAEQIAALTSATAEALEVKDEDEATARLVRVAELLAELEGPQAADLLVDILGSASLEARVAAGEALEDLAFDRFKELALAVERALERLPLGNVALTELPYLLSEVPEPGVHRLLGRFLAHRDPEAVAATIEAIVDHADVGAMDLLLPLEEDTRQVDMDDEEGEGGRVTIGELAAEARSVLAELGGAPVSKPEPAPKGQTPPRGGRR
jgi:hypothetical protein